MALVHLSFLILGGLFIGIPIVLHLLMRRKPKHLVFPALRFVKERRETNRRRLRLRHWLLLLLRCLVVALLAAALARPSVASAAVGNWAILGLLVALLVVVLLLFVASLVERKGLVFSGALGVIAATLLIASVALLAITLSGGSRVRIGDQEAPVAAMLVVDASPRMAYRQKNRTRLEEASETAQWLLDQLPQESEVAVVSSHPDGSLPPVDQAAAHKTLERLQITNVPRPLVTLLSDALDLAEKSDKPRKEVYVFTDLTAAAWRGEAEGGLQKRLAASPEVLLYVIDVGAADPRNFSLGELRLSGQALAKNSELRLQTEITSVGPGGRRSVAVYLEDLDPRLPIDREGDRVLPTPRQRSQESFELPAGGSQAVQFPLRGLELGVHQGFVKLIGEDGLAADDVRYFTVEVQQAWPVLVAAPQNVKTSYLTEALAPYQDKQTGTARFACDVIVQGDLPNRNLADYAAICLVDPAPLTAADWEKLAAYVKAGGGLAIFLGHNAQPPASFNEPAAQALLPGKLARQWRSPGRELSLAPASLDHPVLAQFRTMASTVPWRQFPVFLHWDLTPLNPTARTVLPYSNNKPALIESGLDRGRVLTLTTPVSDPARPSGRPTWNELPTGDNAWPYFVLVNEMLLYLVQSGDTRLNYLAGETAALANQAGRDPERYQLFPPGDEPHEVAAHEGRVRVQSTGQLGAYRLKGNRGGPVVRGFCVNLLPDATALSRAPAGRLDEVLGKDRYRIAANREEITRDVGEARIGREFYPYLLVLLAIVLGLEHLFSNRFYKRNE